jgi:NitT/TauT family transport system permease protein
MRVAEQLRPVAGRIRLLRRPRAGRLWHLHLLGAVLFLGVWQVASLFYPPFLLPGPIAVGEAFIDLAVNEALLQTFLVSMQALIIAMALVLPVGIVLGLLMGGSPKVASLVSPYLDALYVTPNVMLIPLFIIWFGIGLEARVAFIFMTAYFPIVINTMAGVRQIRGDLLEMARAFRASKRDIFFKIYLPGSLPTMIAGIRLGFGRGITGMVAAEMFLALLGLGYMVVDLGNRLQTASVLAMVFLVSVFGIVTTNLIHRIERRVAPWSGELHKG